MPLQSSVAYAASYIDVQVARERLRASVHWTPLLTCRSIDEIAGNTLLFKCENFQRSGSFKARGAFNAVASLGASAACAGVCTHSSGNHGAALALAALERNIPCTVVVPEGAPAAKVRAIREYGARIVSCAPTQSAREAASAAVVEATGATFVHPSESPFMIAGAGTLALELIEAADGRLDAIVAPVGGGGLLSGVVLAAKGALPGIRVYGAEPAAADDAARSFLAKTLLGHAPGFVSTATIADGLRTSLGPNTWPIIRDAVDDVLTVSEAEIVAAMRLVYERLKVVIEPSAAVGVAVAISSAFRAIVGPGARVGVVLCGGNIDLDVPLPFARQQ